MSLGAGAAAVCAWELGCWWRVCVCELGCWCRCCARVGAWVLVPLLCAAAAVCVWELGCWWRCCVRVGAWVLVLVPLLCAHGSLGAGGCVCV